MQNTKNKTSPFLTCFPYRRSPSAFFEGTHGVRSAWGNTRLSHRKVSFSTYATRSRAKKSTLARSLVLIVKFGARFLAALRLAFRLRRGRYRL